MCAATLQRSVAAVSAVVDEEVDAYLESWDGIAKSMREGCYLTLRARLVARFGGEAEASS